MKQRLVLLVLFVGAATTSIAEQDCAAVTIGAFDFSRAGNRSFTEGAAFSATRDIVSEVLSDAEFLSSPTLTESFLVGIQILVISAVGGVTAEPIIPLSHSEQDALLHYVENGGALFAFLDNHNYSGSGIETPFGLVSGGVLPNTVFAQIVDSTHVIASGLYGVSLPLEQRWPGAFTTAPIHADVVVENSIGPALVVFERGALDVNSGRCVFSSDNNSWNSGVIGANEILFRNILLFLTNRGTSVSIKQSTWGSIKARYEGVK